MCFRFGRIQNGPVWAFLALCVLFEGANWSGAAAAPLTEGEFNSKMYYCKTAGWDSASAACATMPTWDTSAITNFNSLFAGATSFNIDISGWDTRSVTTMNGLFNGASSFNVDISNWDVRNVRHMSWTFWGASNFNVDLTKWDTRMVQDTLLMFDGCPKHSFSDVDECMQEVRCGAIATCENTDGSFSCACNPGFVDWSVGGAAAGTNCDENQCATGNNNCHANATCTDTEGSFSCACDANFVDWSVGTDGTSCDENQCTSGTHNCAAQATCFDTDGSFTCECNSGWTSLDAGLTCENVDECSAGSHNCDADNAVCQDSDGSFTCTCAPEWQSSDAGVTCTPVPKLEVDFIAILGKTTVEQFELSKKDKYMTAVSQVAAIGMDKVLKANAQEKQQARRRLLASDILVYTTVEVEARRASAVQISLASDLKRVLAAQGIVLEEFVLGTELPSVEDPAVTSEEKGTPSVVWAVVGAVIGLAIAAAVTVAVYCLRKRHVGRNRVASCTSDDYDMEKGCEGKKKHSVLEAPTPPPPALTDNKESWPANEPMDVTAIMALEATVLTSSRPASHSTTTTSGNHHANDHEQFSSTGSGTSRAMSTARSAQAPQDGAPQPSVRRQEEIRSPSVPHCWDTEGPEVL